MTADHDPVEAQARRLRELSVRLLVETDSEKAEAPVAQLAEIVETQKRVQPVN